MKILLRCITAFLLLTGWGFAAPAPVAVRTAVLQGRIPPEAFAVLAYVRQHHEAPPGHVGGRRFGNFEGRLPRMDGRGRKMFYQEWDVFPKVRGRSRGVHRLITSEDGRAWYTPNHYETFTELRGVR